MCLIHIMSLIQHKWQLFDDLFLSVYSKDWDVPVKQDVTCAGCFCDYHYQGKPWLVLIAASAVGGGEQTLNSALGPNHMCAPLEHACGLNSTMVFFLLFLQWRSGKPVKARALMTWQGGASHGAFYSVQPMSDPIWNRQQLTRREWIPQKTHDPFERVWTHWIQSAATSFLFSWPCKEKPTFMFGKPGWFLSWWAAVYFVD